MSERAVLETFDLNVNEGDGFRVACAEDGARRCIKNISWDGFSADGLPMAWGMHEKVRKGAPPRCLHTSAGMSS